ncbi:hypothetical protein UFOVP242_218 [uncultured Caudovirales phage]|uniref:Uncharacterized protein n=1 Tax=uncultured Caudovirales phage TaxID=2100421 RepID=A0A6J7X0W7_9CAUD|nr:hypothetical protein UFOVP242_218 [uncultured Caudovirales phage]
MIYILMIWTAVTGGVRPNYSGMEIQRDWRSLGEFHAELSNSGFQTSKTAHQMCEDAARQLGLKTENYRCVRSK